MVFVTAPSLSVAKQLARAAVEQRLAACVTLLPAAHSIYRWEGQIEASDECQLLLKTTQHRLNALRTWLEDAHPFEVPEFLVLPVIDGSDAYLEWIHAQTAVDTVKYS